MADGKRRDEWERTSATMAHNANMRRGKNTRPKESWQFNPYEIRDRKRRRKNITPIDLAMALGVPVPEEVQAAAERRRNGGK